MCAVQVFDSISWDHIAHSKPQVQTLMENCARILLSLYKYELVERYAYVWNKHKDKHSDEFNLEEVIKGLLYANSVNDIRFCVQQFLISQPEPIHENTVLQEAGKPLFVLFVCLLLCLLLHL